ncbi:MAG: helix-turn-helix transcriptional regulator [Clostridiales bacterium]|nr:helix-turn-helix transcriptional regulator [Clostridiales bacterium]
MGLRILQLYIPYEKKFIKTKRKELGISQREMAYLLGISQSFLTFLETGKRVPSFKTAKRLLSILNCDWTEFYKDD